MGYLTTLHRLWS